MFLLIIVLCDREYITAVIALIVLPVGQGLDQQQAHSTLGQIVQQFGRFAIQGIESATGIGEGQVDAFAVSFQLYIDAFSRIPGIAVVYDICQKFFGDQLEVVSELHRHRQFIEAVSKKPVQSFAFAAVAAQFDMAGKQHVPVMVHNE